MANAKLDPKRTYFAAALVAVGASAVSVALGHNPLATTPAFPASLGLSGGALTLLSVTLGLGFAAFSVRVTRTLARRTRWVRELGRALRPQLTYATNAEIVKTAVLVSLTEEIMFRGILSTLLGVWLSSLVFGVMHAGRGRTRVLYAAWAALTGLALSTMFWLTGSIAGPILAHAVINAANAKFLRDLEPTTRPRPLGGLLSRPRS